MNLNTRGFFVCSAAGEYARGFFCYGGIWSCLPRRFPSSSGYPGRVTSSRSTANFSPIWRRPVSAFRKLDGPYHSFLLESVEGGDKWGRFSFIGIGPSTVFRSRGRLVEIKRLGRTIFEGEVDDPLEKLKEFMGRYRAVEVDGMPRFFGGAVGYIGYDMVRFIERLPEKESDDLTAYDMYFMIAQTIVIFDNVKNSIKVAVNISLEDDADTASAYEEAARRIEAIERRLTRPLKADAPPAGKAGVAVAGVTHHKGRLSQDRRPRQGVYRKR